jgi:hypothetical protein
LARLREHCEEEDHSDGEMKDTTHFWLRQQAKTFLSTGIQKLVERCEEYVAKGGDYAEK